MPVVTKSSEEEGAWGEDVSEVQPDTTINSIDTPETAPKNDTTMRVIHQAFGEPSNVSVRNTFMEQPGPSSRPTYANLNNLGLSPFSLNSLTSSLSNVLQLGEYGGHYSYLSSASSSMSELYNSINNSANNSGTSRFALNSPVEGNIGQCVNTSDSEIEKPYSEYEKDKNKKNIFKTLQGQAEIISNWSIKENDSRNIWILMGGNAQDKVRKMHNVNSGSIGTGDGFSVGGGGGVTPTGSSGDSSASASVEDYFGAMNFSNETSDAESEAKGSIDDSSDEDNEFQFFEEFSVPPEVKPINRVFPCRRCLPTTYFISKYYWGKHVMNEHGREFRKMNKDKLFECSTCSKTFGQKRSRNNHAKAHGLPMEKC
ncbi:unnamed protein product [Orchesella dallaii]|uniref:C2H2-type domain-containing protein n=1 Tax=Orchesella dallaii TaxID=48710 RepID=A0ABP1PRL7_9HEXA